MEGADNASFKSKKERHADCIKSQTERVSDMWLLKQLLRYGI